jgi:branched-chain amino acid transport system substrate-binding protein
MPPSAAPASPDPAPPRAPLRRRAVRAVAALAACAVLAGMPEAGRADISSSVVKIGVLTDQTGLYAELAGQGSVEAARMAVEDFGGTVAGTPVEILSADHQNDPEIGRSIVQDWVEVDGVDVVVDVPTSNVATAVQEVTRDSDTALLVSGAASDTLSGETCAPTSVQWTYTTHALAAGAVPPLLAEDATRWFFVTADYSFGDALQGAAARMVQDGGGEVLGSNRHVRDAGDLTAHLMEAQGSEADAIAFANAGVDAQLAVRQAVELGIRRGPQRLVPLLLFLTDVKALGLKTAQGLPVTTAFYWDRTDASRAFAERFAARRNGQRPTMVQAGVYSAVMHYLEAAAAISDDGGTAVVEQMKRMPVDDFFAQGGEVRADGLMVHDMFRARVKTPERSAGPWDLYEIVERIPADQAFPPLSESACPLVED